MLLSASAYSQSNGEVNSKIHAITFKTQFIQIKDEFNYGLAYSGINLVAAYSYSKFGDKSLIEYTPEIAFGGIFNKGAGFAWRFKPIDLYYGRKLKSNPLTIGAYFAADYQWQQYSELQGGRLFWFSTIEVGPKLVFEFPYKAHLLNVSFSNSVAGFSSRPLPSTESHYYAFSFSEFVSVAHQNIKFGSIDLFNRTKIGFDFKHASWKRFSIAYSFEYLGYYKEPQLNFLCHSLNLNWKI